MTSNSYPADPRNCFLSSKEAIARIGWGRTKGYLMLRTASFPKSIGGRFRLDTIHAYEERVLAGEIDPDAELRALGADTTGDREAGPAETPVEVADTAPAAPEQARKGGRRRNARSAPLEAA